jgi:hypothetical protein
MGHGHHRDYAWRPVRETLVTTVVPASSIIDVSRPQPTRTHRALSLFADATLAILLALALPLVLTAIGLPLVWLVKAAAAVVDVDLF